MRELDSITDSMDMSLSRIWETEGQGSLGSAVHGVATSLTQLSNKEEDA